MQTSLERIANKAGRVKKYRFQNLYRELNEDLLRQSWKKLNKKSAAGVDKVSYQEYDRRKEGNITALVERLKAKRYKARLVKRKEIPKGNGRVRPLGIPVTEDKLLQYAAKEILTAVYEGDFLRSSYGYRQGRGAREAADAVKRELDCGKYRYVVEADIKGYFDNLDHDWIEKMLRQRIEDAAFIRLIKKWLKAGVLKTNGELIYPSTGSPQGGVISPVLSNIYMHYVLNLWFA
jgi:group II intron reverse transcriptase/maturase